MRIQMRVSSASPAGVRNEGHVYDVDEPEASQLIVGGYAVAANETTAKASEASEADAGWSDADREQIATLEAENAALKEQLAKKASDKLKDEHAENDALKARVTELEAEIAGLTGGGEPETATDPAAGASEQATAPPQN